MKTITFTNRKRIGGYGCSEPGDNSGEYVRADVARELMEACQSALAVLPALEVRNWPPGHAMKKDAVQKLTAVLNKVLPLTTKAEGAE